ncbi:MAG: carbohydrate ABC transporter permease [Eubacteriales bacterium]|nr:carbohydrate ABC transporter permease [Eubacteriales bacterium]
MSRVIGRGPVVLTRTVIYALLVLWASTTIFPFAWVLNNSFKDTSLVVGDSFSPAFEQVYRRDRNGVIVRQEVLKDDFGRERYDRMLFDEEGNPVLEKEQGSGELDPESPFAQLMGQSSFERSRPDSELQAYDTLKGSRVYDSASPAVRLSPIWDNYREAFTNPNVNILRGYRNSLVLSGSVTLGVMLLSAMMAYAMTRYVFKGKKVLRSLLVAALMFPAFSTIVPVYRMISSAGLFDTLQGVALVQVAGNLAFATTVMAGFISSLPYELEEAAFIDGAGVFRIFLRVILPLSKSALATVGIFTFIWSYNDLFLQMVLLRSRALMPVSAILREISSQYGTDFGLMAAAVVVVVVPMLIVYIALQQNIIKGLTAGAIKG